MARKTISAAEAGRDLPAFLREVSSRGDEYVVESDGEPLALLIPIDPNAWNRGQADPFIATMDRAATTANMTAEEAERLIEEAIVDVRTEQRAR